MPRHLAATLEGLWRAAMEAGDEPEPRGMRRPPQDSRREEREGVAAGATRADRERAERARAGEPEAFDELVRRHYRSVHATAFHLVGNHEDAEDLTQECFVRAHRALSWFRGQSSFAAWLRRILVHLARDRFRARGRRPLDLPLAEDQAGAPHAGPSQVLGRHELRRMLEDRLAELPEHLRIPLVLRTREGLGYDEIAAATGVTPATARTQVMKARRALLQRMGSHLDPFLGEDRS